MFLEEHLESSLRMIKKNHLQIYKNEEGKIFEMVGELHSWFDEFGCGEDKTPQERLQVRKIRHHREGIDIVAKRLSARYGSKYLSIILEEAERHVREDTNGTIPDKRDYEDPFFFEKLMANHSSSWL